MFIQRVYSGDGEITSPIGGAGASRVEFAATVSSVQYSTDVLGVRGTGEEFIEPFDELVATAELDCARKSAKIVVKNSDKATLIRSPPCG